ncbi:hypothetical protein DL96DRAFT_1706917 [Flagelloscypha sp. PMI_526]|nr:hypothetical protein DL96DRAFT_1706917 [Flagelloscypha sp. PMI_526]
MFNQQHDSDYMNDERYIQLLTQLRLEGKIGESGQNSRAASSDFQISAQVTISTSQPSVENNLPPYSVLPSTPPLRRQQPASSFGVSRNPVRATLSAGASQLTGNWTLPFNTSPTVPFHSSSRVYVVFKGHNPGVKREWAQVTREISGYPGALQKKFPTLEIANSVFRRAKALKLVRGDHIPVESPPDLGIPHTKAEAILQARALDPAVQIRDFYVVSQGIIPGVYASWLEAAANTLAIQDGHADTYLSFEEAVAAWITMKEKGEIRQALF